MNAQISCVGIIREARIDDSRAPLAPIHIEKIKKKYSNIEFYIQSSKNRAYHDNEYEKSGAIINEDLSKCDIIFGVKEIDPESIIQNKTYIFFSHTYKLNTETLINAQGTPGMDKKKLLKSIIDKKVKLIDYENIRNSKGSRYLGFGRFAGIVGCFNTLNLYLYYNKFISLGRAYKINDYERLKNNLSNVIFPKFKLLITGDGRVAKGALELLKHTNIIQVNKHEYLNAEIDKPVFCNLETCDYVSHTNNNNFDLAHFINNPKEYASMAFPYLKLADVFISAHYWDPASPKIFERNQLNELKKLKVIGDITCDVDGSVPSTIKSTSIENPNFYLDKTTMKETKKSENTIAIMAIDNLPSELPRESSLEFGDGIIEHVLPFLIEKDDGRILNATITKEGYFLKKYSYLNDYLNS